MEHCGTICYVLLLSPKGDHHILKEGAWVATKRNSKDSWCSSRRSSTWWYYLPRNCYKNCESSSSVFERDANSTPERHRPSLSPCTAHERVSTHCRYPTWTAGFGEECVCVCIELVHLWVGIIGLQGGVVASLIWQMRFSVLERPISKKCIVLLKLLVFYTLVSNTEAQQGQPKLKLNLFFNRKNNFFFFKEYWVSVAVVLVALLFWTPVYTKRAISTKIRFFIEIGLGNTENRICHIKDATPPPASQ